MRNPYQTDSEKAHLAQEIEQVVSQGGRTVRGDRPFWLSERAIQRDRVELGPVRALMPAYVDGAFLLGFRLEDGSAYGLWYLAHQHNPIAALRVTLQGKTPKGCDLHGAIPDPSMSEEGYQFFAEWLDDTRLICWVCTDNHIVSWTFSAEEALGWALSVHTLYETLTPEQIRARTVQLDIGKANKSTVTWQEPEAVALPPEIPASPVAEVDGGPDDVARLR